VIRWPVVGLPEKDGNNQWQWIGGELRREGKSLANHRIPELSI
jgi:hypothetical protein